jgi:hypothetical protein
MCIQITRTLKLKLPTLTKNLWKVFLFGDLAPWVNLHLHWYHGKNLNFFFLGAGFSTLSGLTQEGEGTNI